MSLGVKGYRIKCRNCKYKSEGFDKEKVEQDMVNHLEKDCEYVKLIDDWETRGITKEMVWILKIGEMEKDLRKFIKKYNAKRKEIDDILDTVFSLW